MMNRPFSQPRFNTDSIPVEKISENLSTHIITTNEDKLRNILDRYERNISGKGKAVTYFSVAMTLLVSLLTSDFKEFLLIPAVVWKGLFILGLIVSVITSLIIKYKEKTPSVNDLINEISGVEKRS
ncbi:hypothetical protein [Serratia sp. P2ACOL2]|uniref:hypothetical protein n=1 Tax=Serratia sp. P2ACOL2 TaxID=2482769 RepID=UPI00138FB712|nr:hypothetical protein [Serratia sp. P2ACOL2]